MAENKVFLTSQIITYIGNKRTLLPEIEKVINTIKERLNKDKLDCVELFSGSGVVARALKQHSQSLHVNDLELYSKIINDCYLTNKSTFKQAKYDYYSSKIKERIKNNLKTDGIISTHYAPQNTEIIKEEERCFYTRENAVLIDTIRDEIDYIEEEYKNFYLAPLLYECSVHTNTSGVFKGFYTDGGIGKFGGRGENALSRIMGDIELKQPVFSNYECDTFIYQADANKLSARLPEVDLIYIDPPYNQHPYGSNYHILNTVATNRLVVDEISKVAGIPKSWNRSDYNKRDKIYEAMDNLIASCKAKYIILSYNNEGFLSENEISSIMKKHGTLETKYIDYTVFRGGIIFERSNKTVEYLFCLKKK
jgi:adenine-specific DNA-methyltransferase